jgi:hypothetical protein
MRDADMPWKGKEAAHAPDVAQEEREPIFEQRRRRRIRHDHDELRRHELPQLRHQEREVPRVMRADHDRVGRGRGDGLCEALRFERSRRAIEVGHGAASTTRTPQRQ